MTDREQTSTTAWQSCPVGSCQRHQECMYSPCRSVGKSTQTTVPCRYACAAFPNCGCEVEALNAPAQTQTTRERTPSFRLMQNHISAAIREAQIERAGCDADGDPCGTDCACLRMVTDDIRGRLDQTTQRSANYAVAGWHENHGVDIRTIRESADDVLWLLGSGAMSVGWKVVPVVVSVVADDVR